jgi:hypothetical protein
MKRRLTELLEESATVMDCPSMEQIAEYLIEHGVTVRDYEYFSPQQVRNMSPKEIHENYTAIMRSMKEWK